MQPGLVTDGIEGFAENGILLKSGKLLEADIVVTATGFHLNVLGDIDIATIAFYPEYRRPPATGFV